MPLRVPFLCVGNAVRSQMAGGLARAPGGPRVDARSAGSRPARYVAPKTIGALRERRIRVRAQESEVIDRGFMERADVVVATCAGAQQACPVAFREDAARWDVPAPMGRGMDAYRAVRDEVEAGVRALLAARGVAPGVVP